MIPAGEYGGGTVIVWDRGNYSADGDALVSWRKGKIHFTLSGKKLSGEWTLLRTRGAEKHWLVMKTGADHSAVSARQDDTSTLSGRTLKQVAAAGGNQSNKSKTSRRTPSKKRPSVRPEPSRAKQTPAAKAPSRRGKAQAMPEFVEPMMALLRKEPPPAATADEWCYEIKFDGYRALGLRDENAVRLMSRNRLDWTEKYLSITEALAQLPEEDFIVDGEIAALDAEGRPVFQLLQGHSQQQATLVYYIFDLLRINGEDLTGKPFTQRRKRLSDLLKNVSAPLRVSSLLTGDAAQLLEHAARNGIEGLIGKCADSVYECGCRSGAWIKLKCVQSQEFVIGGFTPPQGARQHLGALLVGFRDGESFRFAGKVGTGFNMRMCRELKDLLEPLRQEKPPFHGVPRTAEMRRAFWTEPQLVCQVKFTQWTDDGMLRHPVFLGLREDKRPEDIRREDV